LVVVVLIAEVVRVCRKALCELLLASRRRLLHGRTTECTTLRKLGRQLDACTLKIRVGDIAIGIVDDRIKVLILAKVRAGLRLDVLIAAEDACQGVDLISVAARAIDRVRRCLRLLIRWRGIELAAVRLVWLRILGVSLPNELLVIVCEPIRDFGLGGRRGVLRLSAAAHVIPRTKW